MICPWFSVEGERIHVLQELTRGRHAFTTVGIHLCVVIVGVTLVVGVDTKRYPMSYSSWNMKDEEDPFMISKASSTSS
jgi:hypothetical protein